MSRRSGSHHENATRANTSANETLWLFAEFAEAANDAASLGGPQLVPEDAKDVAPPIQTIDPLQAAQQLARKMPYLPRRKGERERAGHAIFRLLLASLHAEDRAA